MKGASFKGKTVFITGASRGIGHAIALRLARDGANIAIAAKTTEPHPKLAGTIYTAAEDIIKAGGKALPLAVDIRDENAVEMAIKKTVETFGGLDIVINNASAIWLKPTTETPLKRFDLMMGINTRGTYTVSHFAIPHLKKSAQQGRNPHILNISPPLNMKPHWFKNHVAYTMAKYGMSMCVLGMSEELRDAGIGVNALWPRTAIATAAIQHITGDEGMEASRTPEIMSDAAYQILSKKGSQTTGNFFLDDEVMLASGMTVKDLDKYAVKPGAPLALDFFLDDDTPGPKLSKL